MFRLFWNIHIVVIYTRVIQMYIYMYPHVCRWSMYLDVSTAKSMYLYVYFSSICIYIYIYIHIHYMYIWLYIIYIIQSYNVCIIRIFISIWKFDIHPVLAQVTVTASSSFSELTGAARCPQCVGCCVNHPWMSVSQLRCSEDVLKRFQVLGLAILHNFAILCFFLRIWCFGIDLSHQLSCHARGRELKLEDFDPQTGEAVYRARTPGTVARLPGTKRTSLFLQSQDKDRKVKNWDG